MQDVNQESEELENLFVCELTAVERDILAYLGGFILRIVKKSIGNCEDCEGVLVSDGNDPHSSLIHLKEYVKSAGNLVSPSQAVMSVLIECEENIKAFTQLDAILTLKAPFATILEFLRKSVTLELGTHILMDDERTKIAALLMAYVMRQKVSDQEAATRRIDTEVKFTRLFRLGAMCGLTNNAPPPKAECSKKHVAPFVPWATGRVYLVPLSCGTEYIGQTGRCVNDRLREHQREITKDEADSQHPMLVHLRAYALCFPP
ncbi:hypothetical protein HPB47_006616 [Ixodes persulcatus]|uniref:Uncharacterized protein n=1 Tax=Ixodes persulcatus TaxID=34615 RepID=A0AC60P9T7_IXOPE|nr:hypothetical protein HPB47_006616 [Ixodes persulcatus]